MTMCETRRQPTSGSALSADVVAGRKQLLEELGHRFRDQAANYQRKKPEIRRTSSGKFWNYSLSVSSLSL